MSLISHDPLCHDTFGATNLFASVRGTFGGLNRPAMAHCKNGSQSVQQTELVLDTVLEVLGYFKRSIPAASADNRTFMNFAEELLEKILDAMVKINRDGMIILRQNGEIMEQIFENITQVDIIRNGTALQAYIAASAVKIHALCFFKNATREILTEFNNFSLLDA